MLDLALLSSRNLRGKLNEYIWEMKDLDVESENDENVDNEGLGTI